MRFGQYCVPAGTKANIMNNPKTDTVDAPGVYLTIAVDLWDIKINGKEPELVSDTRIKNELEDKTDSEMTGIVVSTNTSEVYMDADDKLYKEKELYEWQVLKIFLNSIPESISKAKYNDKRYMLCSVVDYLEDEFSEWVQKNCHFRKVTKHDIENGDAFDGAEPGDRMLSDTGVKQFEEKKAEYQNKLHNIGFTYEFRGGLIWD